MDITEPTATAASAGHRPDPRPAAAAAPAVSARGLFKTYGRGEAAVQALNGVDVDFAAGAFTLATAHRWRGAGRRYRTDAPSAVPAAQATSRPHDAIDDWDDLSRGEDPTERPLD